MFHVILFLGLHFTLLLQAAPPKNSVSQRRSPLVPVIVYFLSCIITLLLVLLTATEMPKATKKQTSLRFKVTKRLHQQGSKSSPEAAQLPTTRRTLRSDTRAAIASSEQATPQNQDLARKRCRYCKIKHTAINFTKPERPDILSKVKHIIKLVHIKANL